MPGRNTRVTSFADFKWPRRPNRGLVIGSNVEFDDAPVVESTVEIPLRPPAGASLDATRSGTQRTAYAVEVDLELPRSAGKMLSLPPRGELRNLLLRPAPGEQLIQRLSRLGVQSRVALDGSSVLVVRPVRFARSTLLALPTMTDVLSRLGKPVQFSLSDKGHYSRWVSVRLGGIVGMHELLTDPRSAIVMREFQIRHDGKRIEGSYRRSQTATEIRAVFTEARKRGDLPARIRGGEPDEKWMKTWLARLVESGVLRVGIRDKCVDCRQGGFIALGEFGETYTCPRCGYLARTPSMPTVAYRLSEAAHLFLTQRSDLTVLAIASLSRRAEYAFSYDFEHDIRWGPASQNEFDFVAMLMVASSLGRAKLRESSIAIRF
jgi:hypothetical protein